MKTMNVSGRMLPHFVCVLSKLTGRSSVPESRVTQHMKHLRNYDGEAEHNVD